MQIPRSCFFAVVLLLGAALHAQVPVAPDSPRPWLVSPVVSISPSIPVRRGAACTVQRVTAEVVLTDYLAATTLTVYVENPGPTAAEAELLIPVPDGAVVKAMDFGGKASEGKAVILPKEEARRRYREIVARMKDPAIMEFVNSRMIRSAVFPVPPRGAQAVRISYEYLMTPGPLGRLEYVLPRSESLDYRVPWDIRVTASNRAGDELTAFSPSHRIGVKSTAKHVTEITLDPSAKLEPGPFQLFLQHREKTTRGVLAEPMTFLYPDPAIGGGYFMIVAEVPEVPDVNNAGGLNEVILVLDHSGSMRGELMKQAREAAKQVIASLEPGLFFNIVMYNETVDAMAEKSLAKNEQTQEQAFAFLDSFQARGGTNIHDALIEALTRPLPPAAPGRDKSAVIFLTDGIPTVGKVGERAIRDAAEKAAIASGRRVFTFGVGTEVNAPLLDRLAAKTGGRSTYVLPKENIELKVAAVSDRIRRKMLNAVRMQFLPAGQTGKDLTVRGLYPAQGKLGDVCPGDPVIAVGQYVNAAGPLKAAAPPVRTGIGFQLNRDGDPQAFLSGFLAADTATVANAFVPRFYAARRIAELTEAVREFGVDGIHDPNDPKIRELVNEIVQLSLEYGILTEFTSYFAEEGAVEIDGQMPAAAARTLSLKALDKEVDRKRSEIISHRSGADAVRGSFNAQELADRAELNRRNAVMVGEKAESLQVTARAEKRFVQMDNQSFVRTGRQWTQGTLMNRRVELKPDTVAEFGSREYDEIIDALAQQRRLNALALEGEIILEINGKIALIRNPIR